mmetsp:Transcript_18111/g.39439  ORF Transcript_18111/g.39439 Transcript_18111/m.39439 type:complete len:244 (+) Transcript_18111:213-944(+)
MNKPTRKRQMKEFFPHGQEASEQEEEDEPSDDQGKTVEAPVTKAQKTAAKNAKVPRTAAPGKEKNKDKEKAPEDEKVWVQCNDCDKWRALPSTVDADKLPDIWTCSMNHYDHLRRNCDAPEESYRLPEEEQHMPLKSFLKVWSKKLKCTDRAENRLSNAAITRAKKRKVDAEWVQCGNPSCGKWRAVTRSIDVAAMLRRLNKGKFYGGEGKWFCSMNSWDETTASCSAPQEPLWNCRWNLHGR